MMSGTMRATMVVLAGMSAACTHTVEHAAPPASCNPDDRTGTYRVTYVEQSGTCGPVDTQLVSFNPGPGAQSAGKGCTLNSERWSEGNCKLERDVSCSTPTGTVRTIAVTRAETANGSELSGTASFQIDGQYPCNGTYGIDAVRQ